MVSPSIVQLSLRIVTLIITVLATSAAQAEFRATLRGTTNYTWRGFTKSADKPAVQASIDYEHSSGVYLGSLASTVNFKDRGFDDRSNVEVVPYLGWSFPVKDDWRADLQVQRYIYDGKVFNNESDYNEIYGFLHFQDTFSARVSFSPDYYDREHAAADLAFIGRYTLTETLNVSSGIGYSLTRDVLEYDYLYWNIGMSWYHRYVALDLRYVQSAFFNEMEDVDKDPWRFEPERISATVVFTVTFGF